MNTQQLLTITAVITTISMVAFTLTTSTTAFAQVPPIPSPEEETLTPDGQLPNTGSQLPSQSTDPTATNTNVPLPAIQITSHQDGSQVPVGELTIQGTSSDNQESNCQVYADVNDISPLQNTTAAGTNGDNDYSQWTFTYTQDYQLIAQGVNELTAKISCFDNVTAAPLSEWHSVNVTGVVGGGAITPTPAPAQTTPSPSPVPPPTMAQAPTGNALGASIPSTSTSPSVPFAAPEEPAASSQGLGGGPVVQGGVGGDDDDDDGGDDDDGDDDGDEDGDDDGGENDDGGEGDDG